MRRTNDDDDDGGGGWRTWLFLFLPHGMLESFGRACVFVFFSFFVSRSPEETRHESLLR